MTAFPKHITEECKDGRHEDCDSSVPRVEFGQHDQPCTYHCHAIFGVKEDLRAAARVLER